MTRHHRLARWQLQPAHVGMAGILLLLRLFQYASAQGGVVDPGADFQGYMDDLKQKEQEAERHRHLVSEHELWRQSTWSGYAVRKLQAFGNHFSPFFEALADLVEGTGQEETPGAVVLTLLIRILVISAYLVAAYAIARILNSIVGKEIVIEEEIVIEDEDDSDTNKADDDKKSK